MLTSKTPHHTRAYVPQVFSGVSRRAYHHQHLQHINIFVKNKSLLSKGVNVRIVKIFSKPTPVLMQRGLATTGIELANSRTPIVRALIIVSKITLFGVVVGMLSTGFTVYRLRKVTQQLETMTHFDETELVRVRRHHANLIEFNSPKKWAAFQGMIKPMIAYVWAAMYLLATHSELDSESIDEKDKQARRDLLDAMVSWRSFASPDIALEEFPRTLNLDQVQQMFGPVLAANNIKDLDEYIPDLSYMFQQLLDVVYLAQPQSPMDAFTNSPRTSNHDAFDNLQPPSHSGLNSRMLSPIAFLQTTYCSLGIGLLIENIKAHDHGHDHQHSRQSKRHTDSENATPYKERELEMLFASLDPLGTGTVTRNAVLAWTKFLVAAVACSNLDKNTIDRDEAQRLVDKWTASSPTFRDDVDINAADWTGDRPVSAGGWSKDDFLVFAPTLIAEWKSIYAKRDRHNKSNRN